MGRVEETARLTGGVSFRRGDGGALFTQVCSTEKQGGDGVWRMN